MDKTALICTIIFFVIIFSWKLFDYFIKLYRNQNMYKKVGWIAEKDRHNICYSEFVRLRDYELLSYIIEEQNKLNLSKEFCIDYSNEKEKQDAEELLNIHRAEVIKNYFHGFLISNKVICKLNSLEYYIFSLFNHVDNLIVKNSRYHDFNKTHYKLYLITRKFCEINSKITISSSINPKQIEKKILEGKNNHGTNNF